MNWIGLSSEKSHALSFLSTPPGQVVGIKADFNFSMAYRLDQKVTKSKNMSFLCTAVLFFYIPI